MSQNTSTNTTESTPATSEGNIDVLQAGLKSAVNREILDTQYRVGEPGLLDTAKETILETATSAKETLLGTAASAKDTIIGTATAAKDFVLEKVSSVTSPTSELVSDDTTTVSDGILLSDAAAGKVKALLDQEGRDDLALRVAVQPGGCSGLRYQLFFDERSLDGDVVKDFGGVKVVTDRMSAPYLGGASIDFVDTIEKQGFTIDNPNATGSCACGDSFH